MERWGDVLDRLGAVGIRQRVSMKLLVADGPSGRWDGQRMDGVGHLPRRVRLFGRTYSGRSPVSADGAHAGQRVSPNTVPYW